MRTQSASRERRNFAPPPPNCTQSLIWHALGAPPGTELLPPRFLPRGSLLLLLSAPHTLLRPTAPGHAHMPLLFSPSVLLPLPALPHARWPPEAPVQGKQGANARFMPEDPLNAGQSRWTSAKAGQSRVGVLDAVRRCSRREPPES